MSSSTLEGNDRLSELLAVWIEGREAGREIPLEELCRDQPELRGPLAALVDRLRRTDWLFEQPADGSDSGVAMNGQAGGSVPGLAELARQLSGQQLLDRVAQLRLVPQRVLTKLESELSDSGGSVAAETLLRERTVTAFQLRRLCQDRGEDLMLGDYVLLERIGEGGMGRVYKALQRSMNRVVALKVVHPRAVGKQWTTERFRREIAAAARLSHPHIVTFHDAGECRGQQFLVMEHVEGGNLATLVRRSGPLPVELAVEYILQAARALEYAHAAGIIHRDIKPSNLLLDKSGNVRVLDLGLARIVNDEAAGGEPAAELTSSGQAMGTADYLAPEQALDSRQADERSDIYSLGCTLFYLLHGRTVYAGDSVVGRLLAHQSAPVPDLQCGRSDLPDSLAGAFARMIAKDPHDRYPTMRALIESLAGGGGDHDPAASLPAAAAIRRKLAGKLRDRRWLALALAAAVLIAAGAALGLLRPRPLPPPPAADAPFTPLQARTLQERWAKHLGVGERLDNSLGMGFRLIPPGQFVMGTAKGQLPTVAGDSASWKAATLSETPPHLVRLTRPFYLGETEVTQEEYLAVTGQNPSHFSQAGSGAAEAASLDTGRHPVEEVSWLDAVRFCNVLSKREGRPPCYVIDGDDVRLMAGPLAGYRLPTEAEWEFACRAGSTSKYSFGDDAALLAAYATCDLNANGRTHPVMGREPNAFGLFDMHGNVWEWCYDWVDRQYYLRGAMTDPIGPDRGERRAHRGGSWDNPPDRCRSAQRSAGDPSSHSRFRGLRVVLSLDRAAD